MSLFVCLSVNFALIQMLTHLKNLSLGINLKYTFISGQVKINGHRKDTKIAGPSSDCEKRETKYVKGNNKFSKFVLLDLFCDNKLRNLNI